MRYDLTLTKAGLGKPEAPLDLVYGYGYRVFYIGQGG